MKNSSIDRPAAADGSGNVEQVTLATKCGAAQLGFCALAAWRQHSRLKPG